MNDIYPAIVKSYDPARRTARIAIPGLTDGADVFPEAEFCNPIGDKSEHTEIRVIPGDRVWVSFIGGDTRYPLIMGYRPKHIGNATGTRRFHHDNMQIEIDGVLSLEAGSEVLIKSGGSTVTVTPGGITIKASAVTIDAPNTTFTGNVAIGGNATVTTLTASNDVMAGGKSSKTHTHPVAGPNTLAPS